MEEGERERERKSEESEKNLDGCSSMENQIICFDLLKEHIISLTQSSLNSPPSGASLSSFPVL